MTDVRFAATGAPMFFYNLTALFLLLSGAEIYFVPYLLSLDFVVHQWIQEQRSCGLDTVAVVLQHWTGSQLLAPVIVVLAFAVLFYSRRRWHESLRFFVLIGAGALICEIAKLAVIRPRPSVLPFVSVGHSFPSGHVVNSLLLLAGVYSLFNERCRAKNWVKLTGGVLIGAIILVIAWQRLYWSRHWMTDVIGGLLLGSAWVCFVAARWRHRVTVVWYGGLGLSIAVGFVLPWLMPTLRIRLPSPLTVRHQPVARADFASLPAKNFTVDQWSSAREELGRPIRTMTGRESSVYVRLPTKMGYMLALGMRPTVKANIYSCSRMKVFLNDRLLKEISLHEGWRDYSVVVPKEKVIAGRNKVTFHSSPEESLPSVFMYLEIYSRDAFLRNLRGRLQPTSLGMQ
jgi:membrane-associated phospholipid phosphatase